MISIVLPVYNAEEHIKNAIDSLQRQTLQQYELIIVDDGSRDHTAQFIRSYNDKRINVISLEKNRGIVDALNIGIQNATSAYIARMDADDLCHENRLQQQYDFLRENEHIGAVSCRVRCETTQHNKGMQEFVTWTNTLLSCEEIYRNRFVETPLIHPSMMFRKSLIDKHGGYSHDFPEDYELWLRWLHHGVRIQKLPEYLFTWNDPPQRLTRTDPRYHESQFYACKTHYLAKWLDKKGIGEVVVWGAGKKARQYAALLRDYGVNIQGYIDVDAKKIGKTIHQKPVYHYEKDFVQYSDFFVLSYVGNRGIRDKITAYLEERGLTNGVDFLLMA
ncbi:glycosyltransferase [Candidatus Uabimicrobium amorphum]|uniref:Glycosyl transferase family 2 n=1 Tax=Uabimicrobium amorphum TaxID=2596890 RepID=A0A5S9IVL8_UABAM|nr:glycosyltransferase [Candidatus Uabimicrobium amorphum]BBM87920.1 glycosyl transferase family 2 [Candidatus Uabimicrobium amorphum]